MSHLRTRLPFPTLIPAPLFRRTSQFSTDHLAPSRAWIAPFCAALAYFSTLTLSDEVPVEMLFAHLSASSNQTGCVCEDFQDPDECSETSIGNISLPARPRT
jgi:hypothetical protein